MDIHLSKEYLSLHGRLRSLRQNLLPLSFTPLGIYSAREYDCCKGFIALAHAEIEHFIESRCLITATTCVDNWMKNRSFSHVVLALHTICYSGWADLAEGHQFKKLTIEQSVEARVSCSLTQYTQCVNGNNGIKIDDIKKLVIPLSIRMSDLDQDWLSAMNTLGQTRGQTVHQSSIGVINHPDPKDIIRDMSDTILPGLRMLDALITKLLIG